MAKRTYVPKAFSVTHALAVYLTRNNAKITAALTATAPEALAEYAAMYQAVLALDALRETVLTFLP